MKRKKKPEANIWLEEKQLKRALFLLYENYEVSEEELEECKCIVENLNRCPQSASEL